MIRLNMIVEGQTEETFVGRMLSPYLSTKNVFVSVRCVQTSKKNGIRGGVTGYLKAKNDLIRWMKEDSSAWYTTMFDLYALPADFPGDHSNSQMPFEKVESIEYGFNKDVGQIIDVRRFIPYIQLHEFEALLLSDPGKFRCYFSESEKGKYIDQLIVECEKYETPELINQGRETAPSKRIISLIPEYEGLKTTAGPIIAEEIGLEMIRKKCPHFSAWLNKLETLG